MSYETQARPMMTQDSLEPTPLGRYSLASELRALGAVVQREWKIFVRSSKTHIIRNQAVDAIMENRDDNGEMINV